MVEEPFIGGSNQPFIKRLIGQFLLPNIKVQRPPLKMLTWQFTLHKHTVGNLLFMLKIQYSAKFLTVNFNFLR